MRKNKIVKLRLSEELLEQTRKRSENVSRYIRDSLRKNLQISEETGETPDFIPEIKVKTPYTFFATLEKVVDGDTLYVEADLGFYINAHIKIRLLGINAPAIDTQEGKKAKKFLEKELTGSQLVIETRKKGKYGRYLALIYYHPTYTTFTEIIRHGKIINEELLENGLADEYRGS